nr:pyrroloquinoline quinone precursor peptide PqqA [Cereibacter changlensis]
MLTEETDMAWKTPKFDETPVGMEINMYACAKK